MAPESTGEELCDRSSVLAVAVRDAMLPLGVIARPIGTTSVSFCPPLVITDEQVDRCISALEEALRRVQRGATPPRAPAPHDAH